MKEAVNGCPIVGFKGFLKLSLLPRSIEGFGIPVIFFFKPLQQFLEFTIAQFSIQEANQEAVRPEEAKEVGSQFREFSLQVFREPEYDWEIEPKFLTIGIQNAQPSGDSMLYAKDKDAGILALNRVLEVLQALQKSIRYKIICLGGDLNLPDIKVAGEFALED